MNYIPSDPLTETLRRLFQKRVQDSIFAVLGDSDRPGARVDVPGLLGYVYVRFPNGKDANGNVSYTPPTTAWAGDAAYVNAPGVGVYVRYGDDGLEIKGGHKRGMALMGFDARLLNPLNQQSKFVYPWQLTYGLANAVGNTTSPSFLVTVKQFWHYTGNLIQSFETPEQADKIDFESFVPSAGNHRYAVLWVDTYTNTASVTTSTAQPITTPLNNTDIQEAMAGRPPDAMLFKAFYLADDQTSLRQTAKEVDLRQHMDTPSIWGWPRTLNTLERVRDDRTFIVPGDSDSTVSNPNITLETGARLLHVHKSNVTGSAPGTGNDNTQGYSVGSMWFDTATGLLYVASDVSTGAAGWDAVGGGFTSFNVAGDSGTPQAITNGNTLTLAGGTDLSSVASATDTLTINHDDSGVSAGSYSYPALIDVNERGHITSITSGVEPGTMNGFEIAADSGDDLSIENDDVLTLAGGAGIETTNSTLDTVTISIDSTVATLTDSQTLTNKTITSPKINQILDSNGNEEFKFTTTTNAVNELTVANAATGNKPAISATGDDSNIGIDITPKGTGPVVINGSVGIGATPSAGAILQLESTTKAFRPPSMTTTQRDAIVSPVTGSEVFVSDQIDKSLYTGSDWINLRHPFRSIMLNPFGAHTIVSGAALAWVSNTSQAGAGYYQRSAAAINDEVEYAIGLPTGTYHIEYMVVKSSGSGIMSLILDGNTISTHDLYAAVAATNTRGSSSDFNVNIGGVKTLTIKMASKNASSSGYASLISWLQIIRTAEYP